MIYIIYINIYNIYNIYLIYIIYIYNIYIIYINIYIYIIYINIYIYIYIYIYRMLAQVIAEPNMSKLGFNPSVCFKQFHYQPLCFLNHYIRTNVIFDYRYFSFIGETFTRFSGGMSWPIKLCKLRRSLPKLNSHHQPSAIHTIALTTVSVCFVSLQLFSKRDLQIYWHLTNSIKTWKLQKLNYLNLLTY